MTTEREILEKAIDVLDKEGWRRGEYGSYELPVPHCSVGAVMRAQYLLGVEVSSYAPVVGRIADALGWHHHFTKRGRVVGWNDCEAQSKEEVIDKFREAVKAVIRDEELGLQQAP